MNTDAGVRRTRILLDIVGTTPVLAVQGLVCLAKGWTLAGLVLAGGAAAGVWLMHRWVRAARSDERRKRTVNVLAESDVSAFALSVAVVWLIPVPIGASGGPVLMIVMNLVFWMVVVFVRCLDRDGSLAFPNLCLALVTRSRPQLVSTREGYPVVVYARTARKAPRFQGALVTGDVLVQEKEEGDRVPGARRLSYA